MTSSKYHGRYSGACFFINNAACCNTCNENILLLIALPSIIRNKCE